MKPVQPAAKSAITSDICRSAQVARPRGSGFALGKDHVLDGTRRARGKSRPVEHDFRAMPVASPFAVASTNGASAAGPAEMPGAARDPPGSVFVREWFHGSLSRVDPGMDTLAIRRPDDFHVHLRDGDVLRAMAPHSARVFQRVLVMPNLTPPITTVAEMVAYRGRISSAAPELDTCMTFKLMPWMRAEHIDAFHRAGAIAAKLYPAGVTTNSADGISDIADVWPALDAMARNDLPLCVHGELPGAETLHMEAAYLPVLDRVVQAFPRLRIVLEHVSTELGVEWVLAQADNVVGTITAHHLVLTLDDVIGAKIQPHNFCRPVAKQRKDREALRSAALSGSPKFFFGSDSAPHLVGDKECRLGCAGVGSAPVAMQSLADVFDRADRLEAFTSVHGARFYRLELNDGHLTLDRKAATVPGVLDGVVPFLAGTTLPWSIRA